MAYEVNVRHIAQAPDLDGILSKNEWRNAAVIYNFTQKEPVEGAPSSEPTFILISYDDSNIYFGIRCFDQTPKAIVATEMRRDYDLSENDYVEIIIDTFHDQRNAYYFATNSLGARLDCEIKTEGSHLNWDWDGIWHSSARRDPLGWTAEVAIPFQTLRFDNEDDITWGINFGRYIPRKREESYWSPISRNDDFDDYGKFRVSKFGTLRGLSNIGHDTRVQIKPFAIGGLEKNFSFDSPTDKLFDAGLDVKVHLTSNLVSDITINTDFAQVEADQEQVNLSRFSLFFPEKRDFFLEGLDVFNVGEQTNADPFTLLFFSRRIGLVQDQKVPLVGGVKMTGKEEDYELGLLDVYTNKTTIIRFDPQNPAVMDTTPIARTNYSAFRIKRDIFQRSAIGFLALSKDPVAGGDYNRTFAVDGTFSFDNNVSVKGYLAKTVTPGLKGKDQNGFLEASWGNDRYYLWGSYTDIGENFNPEMGFLQWRDIRKYNFQLTVSPRPHFLNTRQTHLSYRIEYITNHDHELQYRTIQPSIFNTFNNESYFFIGLINYYDKVPEPGFVLGEAFVAPRVYTYNVLGTSYASDFSRTLAGSAGIGFGSFYDGTFAGLDLAGQWRPNDKVALELTWDWNSVDLPGAHTFTTSVLGGRLNYSFSTDLFVKTYVQWNRFDKRIVSNVLLNFIHSPGSDFYLVYNQEWDTGAGVSSQNRTLLAKLTYLLNF
ncbi:MAG: DUF5916 domain-containing protein [bacterium]